MRRFEAMETSKVGGVEGKKRPCQAGPPKNCQQKFYFPSLPRGLPTPVH
jgi:hypothetical protein